MSWTVTPPSSRVPSAASVAERLGSARRRIEEERLNRIKHSNKFPIFRFRDFRPVVGSAEPFIPVVAKGQKVWKFVVVRPCDRSLLTVDPHNSDGLASLKAPEVVLGDATLEELSQLGGIAAACDVELSGVADEVYCELFASNLILPLPVVRQQLAILEFPKPPFLFRAETEHLLLLQRSCLGHCPHVEGTQVITQQEVEQGFPSPVVHLLSDGAEILVVLHVFIIDVQDKEPPLLKTSRHHPLFVGSHDQMDAVAGELNVDTFLLDRECIFGDQGLEHTFMPLVTSVERFVAEQHHTVT
jgi:hypothetical protein